MPRHRGRKPPKRKLIGSLEKRYSQPLPDVSFEPENQSHAQLSADNSFASAVSSFLSTDTASTCNTDITNPIEDGTVMEPIQINQSAHDKEMPVQLEVELTDQVGGATVQTCVVPADQVARAQRMIAGAEGAGEAERNKAIEEAIQLLYPYPPREGQRDALWNLIYKRKDLILIAKTSFGKSMILQAASILIRKSITLVVLPLNQIGLEQAEYITRIGGRPCLLNADTISAKVLADIRNGKYTHVLISPELAIGDNSTPRLLIQYLRNGSA
jgi:hypothetical protein